MLRFSEVYLFHYVEAELGQKDVKAAFVDAGQNRIDDNAESLVAL